MTWQEVLQQVVPPFVAFLTGGGLGKVLDIFSDKRAQRGKDQVIKDQDQDIQRLKDLNLVQDNKIKALEQSLKEDRQDLREEVQALQKKAEAWETRYLDLLTSNVIHGHNHKDNK